eukprot:PhF_6_TR581/c1_g1_i2/m.620
MTSKFTEVRVSSFVEESSTEPITPTKSVSSFREDLCQDEQLGSARLHKWNAHNQFIETHNQKLDNSPEYKKASIKILVNEAHWLHQGKQDNFDEHDVALRRRWSAIGRRAMRDFHHAGPQNVIRNLSCMCIFVEGRQAEFYGEHEADRTRRISQQCDILNQLHLKRLQGSKSCFLAGHLQQAKESSSCHQRTASPLTSDNAFRITASQ